MGKKKSKRRSKSRPHNVSRLHAVSWDDRPTISLCMIVKDEERNLPRCLNSVLGLVDEAIIVDTGSTDGTMKLLREAQRNFKAKKGGRFIILEQPWEANFSKHRNYGIEHARGDFIFQLDADEEVDQQTAGLLLEAAKRMKDGDLQHVGAVFFNLYNVLQGGAKTMILHPHLFRRVGLNTGSLFHFEGHVHNRPIYEGQAINCPMNIFHYGYGEDEEIMLAKQKRRREMVGAWLEKEPDSFWPHFYMSQTLSSEANSSEGTIKHAKEAIRIFYDQELESKGMPKGSLARCYYSWLIVLMRDKKAKEALEVADECLKVLPWYPDPRFFTAWAHMHLGNWEDCQKECVRFFDAQQNALRPEMAANFVGVENLTVDRAPAVTQFWRVAAKHHFGMLEEGEDDGRPVVEVPGYDGGPEDMKLGQIIVGDKAPADELAQGALSG